MSGLTDAEREALADGLHEALCVPDECDDTGMEAYEGLAEALAPHVGRIVAARVAAAEQRITERVEALADMWPVGLCAHRCFRTDAHVAPKNCLYGPDWVRAALGRPTDEATP